MTVAGPVIRKVPVVYFKTETDSVEVYFHIEDYLSTIEEGDTVSIIYNGQLEGKACIVAFVGYWITLNELIASFMLCSLLIAMIKIFYFPKLTDEKSRG
jgi:hypothetical protein